MCAPMNVYSEFKSVHFCGSIRLANGRFLRTHIEIRELFHHGEAGGEFEVVLVI
jgi:hypothetical protein